MTELVWDLYQRGAPYLIDGFANVHPAVAAGFGATKFQPEDATKSGALGSIQPADCDAQPWDFDGAAQPELSADQPEFADAQPEFDEPEWLEAYLSLAMYWATWWLCLRCPKSIPTTLDDPDQWLGGP